jgi:hypothetical protein
MKTFIKTILFILLGLPFKVDAQKKQPDSTSNGKKNETAIQDESNKKDTDNKKETTTVWNNITFLNAANFDFSNTISGSYLGKLNIFAPDIKNTPYGFIAGIMRTKFNYKDTSNATFYSENRLIHPLDSIKQGTKYLREYNQYTTTRSNIVWSFYIQPTFRIVSWGISKKKNSQRANRYLPNTAQPNGVYLHLHGELLVNKTNVTTNIQNLQRDTALIDTTKRLNYTAYQRNPLIFDRTFLNGYFGAGLTTYLDPFGNGNSRFFFQFTFGVTTNYPNWASQDISSTVMNLVPTRSGTAIQSYQSIESGAFFLVRAEFAQMLSDNSQLIIGTDIRGLLPKYSPLYAAYIGLNVNLNALVNIVSDKDKNKDKEK